MIGLTSGGRGRLSGARGVACRLVLGSLCGLVLGCNTILGVDSNEEVEIPPPEELRAWDVPAHPRLIATPERLRELRAQVAASPVAADWYARLRQRADAHLADGSVPLYAKPDGKRLLSVSRRVLDRVSTLALVYHLEEEVAYAAAAWRELQAAAAFPDWNPSHFLDTAEMTHAFALGYDWLYEAWREGQRDTLRQALITMGLQPALETYARGGHWTRTRSNWNLVCNGGIGMGALALLGEVPEEAGTALHRALIGLPFALQEYGPDGGWVEGPAYWHYATQYATYFLSALETTFRTDFGLSGIPGFHQAGWFAIYVTGPAGQAFNFGDGGSRRSDGEELWWLARRFGEPAFAQHQQLAVRPTAFDLLWMTPEVERYALGRSPLPLDRHFRQVDVATLRSAWDDPWALFVGFKGGRNGGSHSHLDLGSFVLDAQGVRWAVDLGRDDYNLPGYFQSVDRRWMYYRMRAEGHNTLVLGPDGEPDQPPSARAPLIRFSSKPDQAFAIADLREAYARQAQRAYRGVAVLGGRRQVLVQDEITAPGGTAGWWFMHTQAAVTIRADSTAAVLSQEGARLWVQVLAPPEARLAVIAAAPLPTSPNPAGQAANAGVRKLAVAVEAAPELRLAVLLQPLAAGEAEPAGLPQVKPLADW